MYKRQSLHNSLNIRLSTNAFFHSSADETDREHNRGWLPGPRDDRDLPSHKKYFAGFSAHYNINFSAVNLQRQLDAYVRWAINWNVAVNATKSIAVTFCWLVCYQWAQSSCLGTTVSSISTRDSPGKPILFCFDKLVVNTYILPLITFDCPVSVYLPPVLESCSRSWSGTESCL